MNNPKFGKWIEIKDGEIPPENDDWYYWIGTAYSEENGVFTAHHDGENFFINWCNQEAEGVTHYMMPTPKPSEGDAFTELRALLDDLEEEFNSNSLPLGARFIVKKIREVIGE